MERGILREITPLQEHDFMYVADRRKKEFDYPVHYHETMELNFVENAKGSRRIVGDSSELVGDYDLVLITSSDLEHVWEQYECKSEDAKSLGIPNNDIRLLDKAILLWETTEDVAKGRRLLERYTLLRYDNHKQYRAWFLKYKDKLFFTESGGWKWLVNTQDKNVPGNDYGVLHYNEVPDQKTPEISDDTDRDNPVLISGVVNNLPNGNKELVIRVKMHNGFHIYGFVSDQDPYIATTFDIQTEGDWKKVGELQIPSFKNLGSTGTTIYEGDVMFRQRLKGSGTGKVTCMVNYQTCDEHACLPPTDVELIFDLR